MGEPETGPGQPVLRHILRQHAEQAAFLWTQYDEALLKPEEDAAKQTEILTDLIDRLEAHLDGLRIAGAEGVKMAAERFSEYPEAGELFVTRMLSSGSPVTVASLDVAKIRRYLETYTPPYDPS